jgi:HSP20 family protein
MVNITRYSPIDDLVDDIFKGFLVRPVAYEGRAAEAAPRLKVDVAEKNGGYLVKAELPGV